MMEHNGSLFEYLGTELSSSVVHKRLAARIIPSALSSNYEIVLKANFFPGEQFHSCYTDAMKPNVGSRHP